jgi:hypothetical protein
MTGTKITKLMQQVLDEAPETTKRQTVLKMAEMGLVTITDFWIIRGGMPGVSASGCKPGTWVTYFEINHQAVEAAMEKNREAVLVARIQRKRTKGWRMPADTVYVGRPTIFGNPWTIESARASGLFLPDACAQVVVDEFRAWLEGKTSPNSEHLGSWHRLADQHARLLDGLESLRGKNLACWCPEG